MSKYTIKQDQMGVDYIEAIDGDTLLIIPVNPSNSDYQAYLKHEAEAK
jgi:hypothetical protein